MSITNDHVLRSRVRRNSHARFWIGGGESDLFADHTKDIVNRCIIENLSDAVPRGPGAGPIEKGGMDHNDLNTLTGIRTTAENLVHWIWDALVSGGVNEDLLYRVRLWETAKGYAEITRAERGLE